MTESPLASTNDLAVRLGVTFTTQQTARAAALLDDASAVVRNYTRQTLSLVTDDVVTLLGTRDQWLFLPERPVQSVSQVAVSGVPLNVGDWSVDGDAVYRYRGWSGRFFRNSSYWNTPDTITVTYTHGYATVPGDIKRVVCKLAQQSWVNPEGLRSFTQGDMSATLASETVGTGGLDAVDMKALDTYRRVRRSVQLTAGMP